MNQALVQDVVQEVMRRLGNRASGGGVRAGEDAPANEPQVRSASARSISVPTGSYGIFSDVEQAVAAATESQKKLVKLSMDDRDAIVKLIKSLAKQNASEWGRIELEET